MENAIQAGGTGGWLSEKMLIFHNLTNLKAAPQEKQPGREEQGGS
jgi:hypothetical protein